MHRVIRQQSMTMVVALGLGVGLWYSGEVGRWAFASLILMIVPGWWWQRLWPLAQVPRVGRWMMQALIGPSLVVIVYAWAAWFDVRVPVTWLWVGLIGLTLGMVWRLRLETWRHVHQAGWYVTLIGVVLLVGVTRWMHIDGLVLPPWVDGVHHALLVRVAVEQSHAAWNLLPYLPVDPLLYHTGWHSVMAFVWTTAPTSFVNLGMFLLILGQGWNLLAVVSVAGLAWYWWRSWPATVIVVIVAGLWSVMPAYYLSWGRYTLLAGMTWLPVAMVALDLLWADDEQHRWVWVVPIIVGLAMSHFVVGVMVMVWGVVRWMYYGRIMQRWYVVVMLIMVCMLPWWSVFVSQVQWQFTGDASARVVTGNASNNAFVPSLFWARHHIWLVPMALIGAGWSIYRRHVLVGLLVIWWALVIALANPVFIGLPYLSFFSNEIWITAMYVPIALLIARFGVGLHHRWLHVALMVVAVISFGGMQRIVRTETVLTNDADMRALTWIDAQLPNDAVILTNVTEWMWQVDRGVDGGWWVMPLTGRATTTPPVLFTYADDAVARALYTQTTQVRQIRTAAQLDAWLAANPAITHIYATTRGGITPNMVATLPRATRLYMMGDVAIYAVHP